MCYLELENISKVYTSGSEPVTVQSVEISLRAMDDKKVLSQSHVITEDGRYYILVKRGVIVTKNGVGGNWESTITISLTGTLESGEKIPIREIYYGTENDCMLI